MIKEKVSECELGKAGFFSHAFASFSFVFLNVLICASVCVSGGRKGLFPYRNSV